MIWYSHSCMIREVFHATHAKVFELCFNIQQLPDTLWAFSVCTACPASTRRGSEGALEADGILVLVGQLVWASCFISQNWWWGPGALTVGAGGSAATNALERSHPSFPAEILQRTVGECGWGGWLGPDPLGNLHLFFSYWHMITCVERSYW